MKLVLLDFDVDLSAWQYHQFFGAGVANLWREKVKLFLEGLAMLGMQLH